MRDFDYTIIGGGCAGLSLAYELEIYEKLKKKTLAIIEPRDEYKRDKTWSFWKTIPHHFDDCVKKNWNHFSINIPNKTKYLECNNYPYQSIDSGLFYDKILNKLKENKNIHFFKNITEINLENSFVFDSVPRINTGMTGLWQHFCGVEIETNNNVFDEEIINLMDFDCDQKKSVHFFYTLPYSKNNRFYISHNFAEIKKTLKIADLFYESSFSSIKEIPFMFRFSILVARRVYRKIGHNILKKENIENYNNSGKIYVNNFNKLIQTFLSIYDLIKLSLIKSEDHLRYNEHQIINEKINLNERL